MHLRHLRRALPWLWAIVGTIALSLPGSRLPGLNNYDKLAHAVLFAGWLSLWLHAGHRLRWGLLAGAVVAPLSEYYQYALIPRREGSLGDVYADWAGLLLVVIIIAIVRVCRPTAEPAA
ncbi:MAG: VanZ family protein [Planctomycetota bacterium]|jgi:VanZ family protein